MVQKLHAEVAYPGHELSFQDLRGSTNYYGIKFIDWTMIYVRTVSMSER